MLDDLSGTEYHRFERCPYPTDQHLDFFGQPEIHPSQQPSTAHEMDPLDDQILRQFRRRLRQTGQHRINHGRDRLFDCASYFFWSQHHRLGETAHELAASYLRTDLVIGGCGRPEHDLDLLGRSLTDRNAVLAANVSLDGIVHIEGTNAHRFQRHHAPEGNQRSLGGATTDIDHHVADRLVDRHVGTDRSDQRLFDQTSIGGTCTLRCFRDGSTLDGGDRRRDTDDHARSIDSTHTDALQQQSDHALRHLEVGDGALSQRPHRNDVTRRAADHLPRVVAHREHFTGSTVERDDRGLVQDDALTSCIHQCVGGTEIDREVACQS